MSILSFLRNIFKQGIRDSPRRITMALFRKYYESKSIKILKGNKDLWKDLILYLDRTTSTGCSFTDYAYLYNYIIKHKPQEILECGTGVTTIVIAHALKYLNNNGHLVSMESHKEWYDIAVKNFPDNLKAYVEIRLSPAVEDYYSLFRGMRYQEIPQREYELVFVDGPETTASDGTFTFNFDFVNVVKNTKKPVSAIIDKRLSTVWVFQKIFGNKVKYDSIRNLGYVKKVTKEDFKYFSKIEPSTSFGNSKNLFLEIDLHLKFDNYLEEIRK